MNMDSHNNKNKRKRFENSKNNGKKIRWDVPNHSKIIKIINNFILEKKRKNRDFILMSRISSMPQYKQLYQPIFNRCKINRIGSDGISREYRGIKAYIETYGNNLLEVSEYSKETKKGIIVKPIIRIVNNSN